MDKQIILVGFMGCGKSTVGSQLAQRLNCSFIDTDVYIEDKFKMSISDIFKEKGESFFRKQETACLEDVLEISESKVISVGGGTPVIAENRILLKKLGIVVYLKASPKVIYERIKNNQSRPLLQVENPKERIQLLMSEREAYYEMVADWILPIDSLKVNEVVERIFQKVKEKKRFENISD